jgi:hypothetical protein
MSSRLASCSCLAVIVFVCAATAADAAYRVPFQHARWPNVIVSPEVSGPTALLAVHNTDDDPVGIVVVIDKPDGTTAWSSAYVLDPKQTRTWNLRDLHLPYSPTAEYPTGAFSGSIEVSGERHVLIGDILPVDPGKGLAEGNQLLPHHEECASTCDRFALRYMQGGAFSGGTSVQVLRERHPFGSETIAGELYDEPGNRVGGFALAGWPLSFRFNVGDYHPAEPFGTLYLDNVKSGAVTATYSTFGLYSVGLEAWCIPPCDHCDPLGACYEEDNPSCGDSCVASEIQLSGNATCTVGAPFAAVLSATGTHLEAITCTPLPSGLVRNGNNITGTCHDTLVPSFTCSVENACGEDSVTIPVVPGASAPSLSILKTLETKGCAPAGGTAPVVFTIKVTNTGTAPITVSVTDAVTPACNRANLALAVGQAVTYTCESAYPSGPGTNTAVASIVGSSVTASSTANFRVSECALNCEGVGSPAFSFDIVSQTATSVTVRSMSTFPAGFAGNNDMLAPAPSSGFAGGPVTSAIAYDSTYPRPANGQAPTVVNGALKVSKGSEVCATVAKNVTVPPQPPVPTCAQFPLPITLTPDVTTTPLQVIVNAIAANPAGGTFTPTLPRTYERPPTDAAAQTMTFTYTLPYTPTPGLVCQAQKSVDIPVPPKAACGECLGKVSRLTLQFLSDEGKTVKVVARHSTDVTAFESFVAAGGEFTVVGPSSSTGGFDGTLGTEIKIYLNGAYHTTIHTSCSQPIGPGLTSGQFMVVSGESKHGGTLCALCTAAPSVTSFAVNSSGSTLTGTASVRNAGEWDLNIAATSSESECTSSNYDYPEKDHDEKILGCGGSGTLSVSYHWSDHAAEWWRVTLRRNGQLWQQSSCIRNNQN